MDQSRKDDTSKVECTMKESLRKQVCGSKFHPWGEIDVGMNTDVPTTYSGKDI